MIISRYGDVAIDQGNHNNGVLNNSTLAGAGLTFGAGSGEGIASKRTTGGNQYGLDFYAGFSNRMSILNNGFVGIGRQAPITGADVFAVRSPALNGYGGMYVDTAGTNAWPFYGYALNGSPFAWTTLDGADGNKWKLYNGGFWVTVDPSGNVGLGTTVPTDKLDVEGNIRLNDNVLFLRNGTDRHHGLAFSNTVSGISINGPILWGYDGGALGAVTTDSPDVVTLKWDWLGNVWISNNLSLASLTVAPPNGAQGFNLVGSRSGNFSTPLAYLENTNASGNSSPVLRLLGRGNAVDGVLNVGLVGTGKIMAFGGSGGEVANVTSNGTFNALAFNPTSDRNAKENFQVISAKEVLDKVAALPITRWNFKQEPATPHLGPMAQDFYAAFGVGPDERHIATVDADGVALAAIQGLNQKLDEQRAENAELKQRLERLEQLLKQNNRGAK